MADGRPCTDGCGVSGYLVYLSSLGLWASQISGIGNVCIVPEDVSREKEKAVCLFMCLQWFVCPVCLVCCVRRFIWGRRLWKKRHWDIFCAMRIRITDTGTICGYWSACSACAFIGSIRLCGWRRTCQNRIVNLPVTKKP